MEGVSFSRYCEWKGEGVQGTSLTHPYISRPSGIFLFCSISHRAMNRSGMIFVKMQMGGVRGFEAHGLKVNEYS